MVGIDGGTEKLPSDVVALDQVFIAQARPIAEGEREILDWFVAKGAPHATRRDSSVRSIAF